MFAMLCIYWYDSGRCERDSRSRQTTAQQSKIKKKLYKDIHI
jgi:hypothetical protein